MRTNLLFLFCLTLFLSSFWPESGSGCYSRSRVRPNDTKSYRFNFAGHISNIRRSHARTLDL